MLRRILVILMLASALFAHVAHADGKAFAMVRDGDFDPDIPAQRALLCWWDGRESLVVQSALRVPSAPAVEAVDAPLEIAWVVPVPGVPEVSAPEAGCFDEVMHSLRFSARADVTRVRDTVFEVVAIVALATLLGALVLVANDAICRPVRQRVSRGAVFGVVVAAVSAILVLLLMPALAKARGSAGIEGIELVGELQAGPHDVRVVRGDDGTAIAAWLREEGFVVSERSAAVLDAEARAGWCFAAVRTRVSDADREGDDGRWMPALALQFDAEQPIYPMALTATRGTPTQVELHVVAPWRAAAPGGLTLRHASRPQREQEHRWGAAFRYCDIAPPADDRPLVHTLLTTPEAPPVFVDDLRFSADADQSPYREHVTRW